MRLSEAMRAGAKIRPQAFGRLSTARRLFRLFGVSFGPMVGRSCALGAAFEAGHCGSHKTVATEDRDGFRCRVVKGEETTVLETPPEWTEAMHTHTCCPQCSLSGAVHVLITHLNDDHRWTRERIADFVAAIEDQIAEDKACAERWKAESVEVAELKDPLVRKLQANIDADIDAEVMKVLKSGQPFSGVLTDVS